MGAAGEITAGGWRLDAGFSAGLAASEARNFYAVYQGDAFGVPARGIIAAMARGHQDRPGGGEQARDSAQLVVHSLAEGYFGAPRTVSGRRAAGVALTSVNRWLFGQTRADAARQLSPVSLTALVFCHTRLGIAQIGSCQGLRWRNHVLAPLMREHTRLMRDGESVATRAIGLDLELSVDYAEEDAEPGDRLVLISQAHGQGTEHTHARLSALMKDDHGPED
ncbi:MAG: hypothetical protein POH28_12450, partial [Acidocella sp.]|nr:hypothetical protein [Acidocella sp.]